MTFWCISHGHRNSLVLINVSFSDTACGHDRDKYERSQHCSGANPGVGQRRGCGFSNSDVSATCQGPAWDVRAREQYPTHWGPCNRRLDFLLWTWNKLILDKPKTEQNISRFVKRSLFLSSPLYCTGWLFSQLGARNPNFNRLYSLFSASRVAPLWPPFPPPDSHILKSMQNLPILIP